MKLPMDTFHSILAGLLLAFIGLMDLIFSDERSNRDDERL